MNFHTIFQLATLVFLGSLTSHLADSGDTEEWPGDGWEALDTIPASFSSDLSDKNGNSWNLLGDGQIGPSPTFNSFFRLSVNKKVFEKGTRAATRGANEFKIQGNLASWEVTRQIKIDQESGLAIYFDHFRKQTTENEEKTDEEEPVRIAYFGVISEPARTIAESINPLGDGGIFVHALRDGEDNAPEFLLLLTGSGASVRPELKISDNLKVQWTYTVAGKPEFVLCHAVAQKDFEDEKMVEEKTKEIFPKGVTAVLTAPESWKKLVANIDLEEKDSPELPNPMRLVAVNALCASLNTNRETNDILWVDQGSLLRGKLSQPPVKLASRFGQFELPMADIAAISGGAGVAREHRVFLRNGIVLRGQASAEGLELKSEEGWTMGIDIDEANHIILHESPERDGLIGKGIQTFVLLHSGEILGLLESDLGFQFSVPWGTFEAKFSDIEELSYLRAPTPRFQVRQKNGSELFGFLLPAEISAPAELGKNATFSSVEVSALWHVGKIPNLEQADPADYEPRTNLKDIDGPALLLVGGNVFCGQLTNTEFQILTNKTASTTISSADLQSIRVDDDGDGNSPTFIFRLKGDTELRGQLAQQVVTFSSNNRDWTIPTLHLRAYQSN